MCKYSAQKGIWKVYAKPVIIVFVIISIIFFAGFFTGRGSLSGEITEIKNNIATAREINNRIAAENTILGRNKQFLEEENQRFREAYYQAYSELTDITSRIGIQGKELFGIGKSILSDNREAQSILEELQE
jgi:hypothetical protein